MSIYFPRRNYYRRYQNLLKNLEILKSKKLLQAISEFAQKLRNFKIIFEI